MIIRESLERNHALSLLADCPLRHDFIVVNANLEDNLVPPSFACRRWVWSAFKDIRLFFATLPRAFLPTLILR